MSGAIVVVGGGLAAQRFIETLRRGGHAGAISLICAEPRLPYDRPPLSKDVLLAAGAEDRLSYRSAEWYAEHDVFVRLGVRASALDHRRRVVHLADGTAAPYSRLLIASGSRPRRLALLDGHDNVGYLRTLPDALRLRGALAPGARLLIVGAGFIGQEVAAAAIRAGVETTIVESAAAPLVDVLGAELGAWLADLHEDSGVRLLLDRRVTAVHGGRTLRAVTLSDDSRVECDHALVGVGAQPDTGWLDGTPLGGSCGVPTDCDGRSAVPGVFAAGDAAATFDPLLGRHALSGHWESAARQGARAAKALLEHDAGPPALASFWSDLYGTRIQYLGHASLADAVRFDGDRAARDFTATFTRRERPVAMLLAGRPQLLPHARAVLTSEWERSAA